MNTHNFWQNFERLFLWGLETLALPGFALAAIACTVIVALIFVRQQPFRRGLWRPSYWLIFTQLLFFPAIISVGVLFAATGNPPRFSRNVAGERVLDGLFYTSLLTAGYWLYRMKGLRWLAASLLILEELVLTGAGFIAGMSVTGDWI